LRQNAAGRLVSVEIYPSDVDAVLLVGLAVFRTLADDVVAAIRSRTNVSVEEEGRTVISPRPVYPATSSPDATIGFGAAATGSADGPPWPGGPWHPAKVMWVVAPGNTGGILLWVVAVGHPRRARLEIVDTFADAAYRPPAELGGDERSYPSLTRNFSYQVLFRAALTR
jgi:hypothetical protein